MGQKGIDAIKIRNQGNYISCPICLFVYLFSYHHRSGVFFFGIYIQQPKNLRFILAPWGKSSTNGFIGGERFATH